MHDGVPPTLTLGRGNPPVEARVKGGNLFPINTDAGPCDIEHVVLYEVSEHVDGALRWSSVSQKGV